MSTMRGLGFDFGTTNSALAEARRGEPVRVARFESDTGPTQSFRSVLYFGREERRGREEWAAGPRAIERYLENEDERRLMQSLKSFLASRLFTSTSVLGRKRTLEDLISRILRSLREESGEAFPLEGATVVVGRPVRFAKAETDRDDALAVTRLRRAFEQAGVEEIHFEFEPVAAAYHYEQQLERDELVMIADFGGGTSDFCLVPVGPSLRGRRRSAGDILGTEGVAIAGDAFDARIVRHLVAPRLGRGSRHRTLFDDWMPVPSWLYRDLERWHHLSFLKSRKTMALLHEVRDGAEQREQLDAFIHIVKDDLGFQLYRSVQQSKLDLTRRDRTVFRFHDPPAQIETPLSREEFDAWIADDLAAIAACVDRLLAQTGTPVERVDRVFMTGGSSFVPAVRKLFADRFGAERIRGGDELTSVASGLALRALDLAG